MAQCVGQQQLSENHYEAAWRMQQWTDVPTEGIAEHAALPFHQAFCSCLKVGTPSDACIQMLREV